MQHDTYFNTIQCLFYTYILAITLFNNPIRLGNIIILKFNKVYTDNETIYSYKNQPNVYSIHDYKDKKWIVNERALRLHLSLILWNFTIIIHSFIWNQRPQWYFKELSWRSGNAWYEKSEEDKSFIWAVQFFLIFCTCLIFYL